MEQFIQQLLKDQGVPDSLDGEVRKQLVEELTGRATDFVNRRLLEAMSEEAVEQFNSLLDEEPVDPNKIQQFIATHVPDKERVAAAALYEFRTLYLGDKA